MASHHLQVPEPPTSPSFNTPTPDDSRRSSVAFPTIDFPDLSQASTRKSEPEDIYRNAGDEKQVIRSPLSYLRPTFPEHRISRVSYASSVSSSSSSSSSFRGPIAGLANLVERAIGRWARHVAHSSDASSSRSSLISYPTYRAPPHTPRQFSLLLPKGTEPRFMRTEDLTRVTAKLEEVVHRRSRHRKGTKGGEEDAEGLTRRRGRKREGKGKTKEGPPGLVPDTSVNPNGQGSSRSPVNADVKPKKARSSWWLDVAAPTAQDMRQIAKLLHLHPLTLEDILYQDPREKLELFPRLGYYLIAFTALPADGATLPYSDTASVAWEGVDMGDLGPSKIEGVTIYAVVFAHGICTFHFHDFNEHLDRVRKRAMQIEDAFPINADWIAHGLMDSIVDGFFPMLNRIEREVDHLTNVIQAFTYYKDVGSKRVAALTTVENDDLTTTKAGKADEIEMAVLNDTKSSYNPSELAPIVKARLSSKIREVFLRLFPVHLLWNILYRRKATKPPHPRLVMLYRVASARRLVTSINRLLVQKHIVLGGLRRRFANSKGIKGDIGIYLGDVDDHVLGMQHALVYCESALSQLHPAYLSQLKVLFEHAKNGMDRRLLMLSLCTITILTMQILVGLFSENVNLPHDAKPGGGYNWFGAVIFGMVVILLCVFSLVRYWWVQSKKRHREMKKRR